MDILALIHLQKIGPIPLLVDRLVELVDGCVRAGVDAWWKERIDGRIDVLPREVINDPLCIAVCCFGGKDSLLVQG